MQTRVTEVADGIYQLTTHFEAIDFGFNQFLVTGDEPLLFHTGMRSIFPLVRDAVGRVLDPATLRWIGFGHVEADECGAMNDWLAAAPGATVVQGRTGCAVSISDLADRAPRPLGDGEMLDIGGHRLRWLDTPHVPHAWEAGLFYDETTRTLLCGDLFTRYGAFPASTDDDIVGPAVAEQAPWLALAPSSPGTVRALADLDVTTLAQMHGSTFTGDCPQALRELADDFERRTAAAA